MTLPAPRLVNSEVRAARIRCAGRTFDVSRARVSLFGRVARQLGTEAVLVQRYSHGGAEFGVASIARVDHEDVVAMITSSSNYDQQRLVAGILYNLYATGNLVLVGHQYPRYIDWRNEQARGMTLDHVLPRQYYPELTFEVSNWQALTQAQNEALGSAIDADDLIAHLDDRMQSMLF